MANERENEITKQLKHLLLMPKAPKGVVMGLYADRRTGLGVAVLDAAGGVLAEAILFSPGQHMHWHEAITLIASLIAQHHVQLIGLGNGFGLPEARRLVHGFKQRYADMPIKYTVVEEAGLLRNSRAVPAAVSIAKRLQHPLFQILEVPVEQMQFAGGDDKVNSKQLVTALKAIITETVQQTGVDANTAPVALLRYVTGVDRELARALVRYREANGMFQARDDLKQIPGMDIAAFEAGDLNALCVPWEDKRPIFKSPEFSSGITTLQALKVGVMLEGVVCRVVSFGAFIDIGVPQLGLLHISLYKKPLHVGDVLQVYVKQADSIKNQIALGLKAPGKTSAAPEHSKRKPQNKVLREGFKPAPLNTAMADALAQLKRGSS
jgi:competence ComEA-like helix-hairpin-helix protein